MKASVISIIFGFLLLVGTAGVSAQQKPDPLITACNQAAVELEHRRAVEPMLEEKIVDQQKIITLQDSLVSLKTDQYSLLSKALDERKITDTKMLEAFDLQHSETLELKTMLVRSQKAEARQRKLKWLFTAAGVAATVFLMK
jgi:hypothetical protein